MNQISPVKLHSAEQGSDEWLRLRCGVLTASAVKEIVTPTLKLAANDKTRALANKIAIQRITGIPEDTFTTDKMLRGHIDEDVARGIYAEKYAPVSEVGFITNDRFPFFGYSPDGLVGVDGLIEVKSRDPHLHLASITARERGEGIPKEYMAQVQVGLLLSGRVWCDFISFSHGLPMMTHRVFPDAGYQAAIAQAAKEFEANVQEIIKAYTAATADPATYTPTERIDYEGMIL
ncbi:putative phage-type endonuclease [Phaeobacter inhibens]|uniref:lambda exonuclease family protein n=1 Tax=Phaeobacter inhibens TaxID=221822 RepID=UPI000C9C39A5|nr:lambda exonuclease family protein [Phaeobacter inhibens]AUR03160.1 putative phage-type endonuclease [Phaeobacter inhibens]